MTLSNYSPLTLSAKSQKQLRFDRAWQVAIEANKLLKEKYGVQTVAVFGSLSHIDKFRDSSDIDLAVWELKDQDYYRALSDLLELNQEFSIDLVQFETASMPLQNTIKNQGIIVDKIAFKYPLVRAKNQLKIMNKYLLLIGKIEQELKELEILVNSNKRLLDKIKITQDDDYLGSIALNLHSFYSGIERIFKQIAQSIDKNIPDQADWHRQLLRQMTITIPDVRPSVISSDTKIILDEYYSFRHVVRNIYSINLKSERVQELAIELPNCFHLLQEELIDFIKIMQENINENR
ncbi:nucleotidyltransferase family protein [Geminocystis sp. CENA526]|uniref:nucleotidyltransferase family protein n=1 Tax=Geminocystis sp. CENA526 TaxID=1355871 RepID=UPI003D6DF226